MQGLRQTSSAGQKLAAVWLDLRLGLTFSLPNEWLGSSIDHGRHQRKRAASLSDINICPLENYQFGGNQQIRLRQWWLDWGQIRFERCAMVGTATPLPPSAKWPGLGFTILFPGSDHWFWGQSSSLPALIVNYTLKIDRKLLPLYNSPNSAKCLELSSLPRWSGTSQSCTRPVWQTVSAHKL